MKKIGYLSFTSLILLCCSPQSSEQKWSGDLKSSSNQYAFCGAAIVFESNRHGNLNQRDIFLSSLDGEFIVRMTDNPADDRLPKLSADGSKIVFASKRDGVSQIYIINIDEKLAGTPGAEKRLFEFDGNAWSPNISDDGMIVLFNGQRENEENANLYLYYLQSNEIEQLTNTDYDELFADFSSDGKRLVFSANPDGNDFELFTMNVDGSNLTQITNNGEDDFFGDWSPDDTKIAYILQQSGEVYIYDTKSQGIINVTNHPAHDSDPSWTGESKSLVFGSFRTGIDNVWIINIETREVRNISQSHHHEGHGDVSRTKRCYGFL